MSSSLAIKLHCPLQTFCLSCELNLATDKITALYGPSGSGKSTFLKALAGLTSWQHNRISYRHEIWQDEHSLLPTYLRQIGVVFQQDSLFPHLNVEQNILYGYKRNPQHLSMEELQHYYQRLGINSLLKASVQSLSGGECQKVALLRALATHPKLMLLDEPFNALDEHTRQLLLNTLREYQQQHRIGVLFISHHNAEVAHIADDLLLIEQGKILHQGDYQAITTNPSIVHQHIANCTLALTAERIKHDEQTGLLIAHVDDQPLNIPLSTHRPINSHNSLRLLIHTRDISLATQPLEHSSIPHHLIGTITEISPHYVQVKLNTQYLLCHVPEHSMSVLKLSIHQQVHLNINHIELTELFKN